MIQDVSPDLFAEAQEFNASAITNLLAEFYPLVWRIAVGVTGRADVGRGVTSFIMKRALNALPNWKDESAPGRWFSHHTLLAARRFSKEAPTLEQDTLLGNSPPEMARMAFVRSLRLLPHQQREAFILTHLENVGARQLAIAMDCSTVAADTHLKEADRKMEALAGDTLLQRVDEMRQAYLSQAPDEPLTIEAARRRVARLIIPWRIRRILRLVFALALLLTLAYAAWWYWRILMHSLDG